PAVATGDGLALAFEAGAELTDLEFFQFHPTALHLAGVPTFLISEAVRGDGGYLVNDVGDRFMLAVDDRGELAPRDVVARAIVREMETRGQESVWLDVRHLPADRVKVRFPTIYQSCLNYGLDITRELIPVAPAAHYYMGGIRTNAWGETSIPHLLACGECACTGVHGANRLASNSLLELLVFARRIVRRTSGEPEAVVEADPTSHPDERVGFALPSPVEGRAGIPSLEDVQTLMWRNAGISRTGLGLAEAARQLDGWLGALAGRRADQRELYNVALVSRLLVEAACRREESRGGHFREDYPQPDPALEKHIVVGKESSA
ncbi:MAG TPA: FAD-binding protein, partial [Dehalococcoidia bacterium]|nr:FAD-binding protein [Dehalococcoidia bacterium]